MEVRKFLFNPFGEMTYLLIDAATKECAVVDPGMWSAEERARFDELIAAEGLKLTKIINTHLHVDHCIGNSYVKKRYGVDVYGNRLDDFLGERVAQQASMFRMDLEEDPADLVTKIDVNVDEGDKIFVGNENLDVLHVPGHSPGSIALYNPKDNFILTGDVLFKMGIGRTDLPGGSYADLVRSLREKIFTLPPDTIVYPGHGPSTTIAAEAI